MSLSLPRPARLPALALALTGALLLPGLVGPPLAQAAEPLTEAQREAVRALVRETLMNDPEIITDAMEVYQNRQEEAEQARVSAALADNHDAITAAGPADTMGNPDGAITVVEFSDYQCGYCKRVFPHLASVVESAGDVRLVIRELPILGPESVTAARAALAARKQGLYPAFHKALMALRGGLSEDAVMQVAQSVGLDIDRLKKDMADPAFDQRFSENVRLARLLGISGTPAFIIGDKLIPGAVSADALEALIAEAREG